MSNLFTTLYNYNASVSTNTTMAFASAVKAIRNNSVCMFSLSSLLNKWSFHELNTIVDEYGNSLLHIATYAKKVEAIKYLLERGMNKHQKNSFNETAWVLAVQTHDQNLIQTFIDTEIGVVTEYKKKADNLTNDIATLRSLNKKLQDANAEQTSKYNYIIMEHNSVKSENEMLKVNNKRMRADCDDLRRENTDLTEKNKKLKTSVESLTNTMRK